MSLQNGLVGQSTMDSQDASGGVLYDRSGYDNHGAINGATPQNSGQVQQSFGFNGSSDEIDSELIETDFSSLTISGWANGTADTEWRFIAGQDDFNGGNEDGGRYSIFYGNNVIRTQINDGTGFYNDDYNVDDSQWNHVLMRYDGSVKETFINGEPVGSNSGPSGGVENISYPFKIGNTASSRDEYFNGSIDDVRVYNRSLSEKEINQLYQMRSQKSQGQGPRFPMTLNGKDVVVKRNQYGAWVLVLNYEHYGGENPTVSPGSQFPQLPNGVSTVSTVNDIGTSGETRHVDGIDEYGSWDVDAVELEATTDNHDRKIHYFTENQTVINSVVPDSTKVSYTDITSEVTKYDDHTANLPDSAGSDTGENSDDHIFGPDFPMYNGGTHHWAIAGFGNRWEVDDYPDDESNTTVHRVWVRTNKL